MTYLEKFSFDPQSLQKLASRYNLSGESVSSYFRMTVLVLVTAYVAAGIVSTLMMSFIMSSVSVGTASGKKFDTDRLAKPVISFGRSLNYVEASRRISERNLFNSDGEFPKEAEPKRNAGNTEMFDPDAPCQRTSLRISLLGTIYLGAKGPSLATIKDEGYTESDIYRAGDSVIGSEALVYAIEPQRVVLNNNGAKECLELQSPEFLASIGAGGSGVALGGGFEGEGSVSSVNLDQAYVEKELGPGFASIISKGRLVPHMPEGTMKGFKLIGVDSASLYGKIGLMNNDVITSVNDTSMTQSDQGFAFYEAFENARDIRITIMRGEKPRTFSVRIK